jgi:hypothetical protein
VIRERVVVDYRGDWMRSFLGVGADFGGEHSGAKIITLAVGEDNGVYCLAINVTKGESS